MVGVEAAERLGERGSGQLTATKPVAGTPASSRPSISVSRSSAVRCA
jgi:hypothetical protein